jgi:short-subunit dehydrogenase
MERVNEQKSKRALVTGALSGIEKHLSEELAPKNYSLLFLKK